MNTPPTASDRVRTELKDRIDRLPRQRLAFLPTPLENLPRLSAALGDVRVLVKRDDQTGLAFGGNKTRMLEFTLGRALADGADCIVAAAYADSNHCRQAAAAAAKLALESWLVLGLQDGVPEWQGNLLLDHLLGARIEFVRARGVADILAAATNRVAALRKKGRHPFLLTYSSDARALGAIAHVAAFLELSIQLERACVRPHSLYVASGGNTYAGLLLGARLTQSNMRVVGIVPEGSSDEGRRAVESLLVRAAEMLELDWPLAVGPAIELDDQFLGPGYGLPSSGGNEALLLTARSEGLLLDPVYTAKGMAGLIAHAKSGRVPAGSTVVFVHTGGGPGIFACAAPLHPGTPAGGVGEVR